MLFNVIEWLKILKITSFKTFMINTVSLPFKYMF